MPVTFVDVVLGKFLAAVVFAAAMLIPTSAFPITVSFLGDLDWGPVVAGYIGAIMLAAAFSAIGLFASSLTRNQIIAFIIGAAICFSLTMIDWVLFFLPRQFWQLCSIWEPTFAFRMRRLPKRTSKCVAFAPRKKFQFKIGSTSSHGIACE